MISSPKTAAQIDYSLSHTFSRYLVHSQGISISDPISTRIWTLDGLLSKISSYLIAYSLLTDNPLPSFGDYFEEYLKNKYTDPKNWYRLTKTLHISLLKFRSESYEADLLFTLLYYPFEKVAIRKYQRLTNWIRDNGLWQGVGDSKDKARINQYYLDEIQLKELAQISVPESQEAILKMIDHIKREKDRTVLLEKNIITFKNDGLVNAGFALWMVVNMLFTVLNFKGAINELIKEGVPVEYGPIDTLADAFLTLINSKIIKKSKVDKTTQLTQRFDKGITVDESLLINQKLFLTTEGDVQRLLTHTYSEDVNIPEEYVKELSPDDDDIVAIDLLRASSISEKYKKTLPLMIPSKYLYGVVKIEWGVFLNFILPKDDSLTYNELMRSIKKLAFDTRMKELEQRKREELSNMIKYLKKEQEELNKELELKAMGDIPEEEIKRREWTRNQPFHNKLIDQIGHTLFYNKYKLKEAKLEESDSDSEESATDILQSYKVINNEDVEQELHSLQVNQLRIKKEAKNELDILYSHLYSELIQKPQQELSTKIKGEGGLHKDIGIAQLILAKKEEVVKSQESEKKADVQLQQSRTLYLQIKTIHGEYYIVQPLNSTDTVLNQRIMIIKGEYVEILPDEAILDHLNESFLISN